MKTPGEQAAESRRELDHIHEGALGRARYQQDIRRAANAALSAINAYEQAREAELEAIREEFRKEVDRERERSVATGRELAAEKARAAEAKKNLERVSELKSDHAALRFNAPLGEYGRHVPWTVADVEQVLYDVRVSGGEDDTELDMSGRQITTRVPYPETVVAGRAAGTDDLQEAKFDRPLERKRMSRDRAMYLLCMALLCLCGGVSASAFIRGVL